MAEIDMKCSLTLDTTAFKDALEKATAWLEEFERRCKAARVVVLPPEDAKLLDVADKPVNFREFF